MQIFFFSLEDLVTTSQSVQAWQRSNTHGQVFQLQLTDSVVGFDVLRDESELEVGLLEDAVPLLPLRPVLGTFDLKVRATGRHDRERQNLTSARQTGYPGRRCSQQEAAAHGSFLYDSVQHHHAAAPLLPHHLPETATRVWQGSLRRVKRATFIRGYPNKKISGSI